MDGALPTVGVAPVLSTNKLTPAQPLHDNSTIISPTQLAHEKAQEKDTFSNRQSTHTRANLDPGPLGMSGHS